MLAPLLPTAIDRYCTSTTLSLCLWAGHQRGVPQLLLRSQRLHRQRRLLYPDDEERMETMTIVFKIDAFKWHPLLKVTSQLKIVSQLRMTSLLKTTSDYWRWEHSGRWHHREDDITRKMTSPGRWHHQEDFLFRRVQLKANFAFLYIFNIYG